MEGLRAAQARVSSIQQQLTMLAAPQAPQTAAATTFDRVLSSTISQTPATQKAPGAYGTLMVPRELSASSNGELGSASLSEIGVESHRLAEPAAAAFRTMRADAARDGIEIGVTDSYRTLAEQVDLADRKGLYSQGGLAATPGTSNHGWGLSLDVDVNDRGQQWLRANAARYGFVEDVPREPWHWTYRPD